MTEILPTLVFLAGLAQLSILIASALVPTQLRWADELQSLPRLHRQMHWVYATYVVLSIIAFAIISILFHEELVSNNTLGRAFCIYVVVFWGVRLGLQGVFDVADYLNTSWKRAGYHLLTLTFVALVVIYTLAGIY